MTREMDREQLLLGLYYIRERVDNIMVQYENERRLEVQVRSEVEGFQNKGVKGSFKSLILFLGAACALFETFLLLLPIRSQIIPFWIMTIAGYLILLPQIIHNNLIWEKKTKYAAGALAIGALGGAIGFAFINFFGFFLFAAFVGITIPLYMKAMNKYKLFTDNKNEEIRLANEQVYAEYDKCEAVINKNRNEIAVETQTWYPKSYCTKVAVDWFIEAVENYRCDNIKELVREFEIDARHKEMMLNQERLRVSMENGFNQVINNQQEMQRMMRVQNILSACNLAATISNGRKIDQNTAAVNRVASNVRDVNAALTGTDDLFYY